MSHPGKFAKLLVVEDEPDILMVHTVYLQKAGYEVVPANNGKEAIEILSKIAKEIDLVVSDVTMPEMDGYELCANLREQEHTRLLPFIFVSGRTSLKEKLKGYELGGQDYIVKPCVPEEMLAKISNVLKVHRANQQFQQQVQMSQAAAMSAITYSSDLGRVIEFILSIANAEKIEMLGERFIEHTQQMGLNVVIQFNLTPSRSFSTSGIVTALETNIMELARKASRFYDYGARTMINYPGFSVLIKNMPIEDNARYGSIKDTLGTVCNVVQSRVEAVVSNDRVKQREDLINAATATTRELDQELTAIRKSNQSAIEQMRIDIENAMLRLGLTDVQEDNIRNIVDTCVNKTDEIFERGESLKVKFADLLKQLSIR